MDVRYLRKQLAELSADVEIIEATSQSCNIILNVIGTPRKKCFRRFDGTPGMVLVLVNAVALVARVISLVGQT